MEKFFSNGILDELYNSKSSEFEDNILKEMKKRNIEFEALEVEEKLTNKIKEVVKDENSKNEILELLNQFELKEGKEEDFWSKMYYKLGAYDCADMKNILKNVSISNEEMEGTFLDDFTDNFMDYLENNRMARLRTIEEYVEIENRMEKIKKDNPKVRLFIDNRENVKLSEEEIEKVLEIINLQGDLENFEYKEIFKLGAREILVFLKQMKLI